MFENDFKVLSAIISELISDLDGTPHAAYIKQLKERHDAFKKLQTEAAGIESLSTKKRSEKQMLKKSKIGDEEHKLVSDRLRQLLGWEM
jgi:hypothetical protein